MVVVTLAKDWWLVNMIGQNTLDVIFELSQSQACKRNFAI